MTLLLALLVNLSAAPYSTPAQQAWAILQAAAEDASAERRAKAVHALRLLRGLRAERMAEAALSDSDKNVRSEGATVLGEMRAFTARTKLRACLDDKEIQVVLACTNSLYLMKDPEAYQVYYAILSGEVKGSKGLLQSQLDTLRDKKQMEKLAFETGIGFVPYGGMGWEAIKTITHDDSSPVRAMAALRLADDPDPRSSNALKEFLGDKKPRVRAAAVEAIAKRGDPKLLSALVPMIEDDNDAVKFDAAAAVIRLSYKATGKRMATKTTAIDYTSK